MANQQKQDDAFKNHAELRKAIDETNSLRQEIEKGKVQIQIKGIEVKVLTDATEAMNDMRDTLTEEKREAEVKNEELKK